MDMKVVMRKFEEVIEAQTGMSIDWIRNTPICEQRKFYEKRRGKPMSVVDCGRIIYTAPDFYRPSCHE